MDTKTITNFFHTLGLSPNLKGYPYLIYVVQIAADEQGKPLPLLKDLYQETAGHFGVTPGIIAHDIRTVLRSYWSRNDGNTFSELTHYPVINSMSIKEFISVSAEYIAHQF